MIKIYTQPPPSLQKPLNTLGIKFANASNELNIKGCIMLKVLVFHFGLASLFCISSCTTPTLEQESESNERVLIKEVEPSGIKEQSSSLQTSPNALFKKSAPITCDVGCNIFMSGSNRPVEPRGTDKVYCIAEGKTFSGSLNINQKSEVRVCGTWEMNNVNLNGKGTSIQVASTGVVKTDKDLNINKGVKWIVNGQLHVSGNLNINDSVTNAGWIKVKGARKQIAINGDAHVNNLCSGSILLEGNNTNFYNNGSLKNQGQIIVYLGRFHHQSNIDLEQTDGARILTYDLTTNSNKIKGDTEGCSIIQYTRSWKNNAHYTSDPAVVDIYITGQRTCEIVPFYELCDEKCTEPDFDSPTTLALGDSLAGYRYQSLVLPVVVSDDSVQANEVIAFGEWVVVAYNTAGPKFKGALQFISDVKGTPYIEREFHFDGMEINALHVVGDRLYIGGAANSDSHPDGSVLTFLDLATINAQALSTHLQFFKSYGITALTSLDNNLYLSVGAAQGGLIALDKDTLKESKFIAQSDIRDVVVKDDVLFALVGSTDLLPEETGSKFWAVNLKKEQQKEFALPPLQSSYHKMQLAILPHNQWALSLAEQGFQIVSGLKMGKVEYQSNLGNSNGMSVYKKWLFVAYGDKGVDMLEYNSSEGSWKSVSFWKNEISNHGVDASSMNSVHFSENHLWIPYGRGGVKILEVPFFEPRCSSTKQL